MGKRKYVVNGTEFTTVLDLVAFLKSHSKLRHCTLADLEDGDGAGRLIWARNPGSVYWPAIIAALEDDPKTQQQPPGDSNGGLMVTPVFLGPQDFRCVMFLESAFRIAVLQWKDIILVDEQNFDAQCELVYQLNINVIKKTWKKDKHYKDAVQLLKEFSTIDIDKRQAHACELSLERKMAKQLNASVNAAAKSRKSESVKTSSEIGVNGINGVNKKSPEIRLRVSEKYGLRQIIPSDKDSSKTESNLGSTSSSSNGASNNSTPCPSIVSETPSDFSRKAKIRPKVGGLLMKEYVETRFMCMEKSFKFTSDPSFKCAQCLETIPDGSHLLCHDMPHHPECLIKVHWNAKDGTPQQSLKCKCCAEQTCFICKVKRGTEDLLPTKCSKCDLRYHRNCLLDYPQAVVQGSNGPLTCPTHFCHSCVGEHYVLRKMRNFKAFSKDRFRCLQCPATYHKPQCLPAGCGENITGRDFIICPKHTLPNLKVFQRRFGCLTCGQNIQGKAEKRVECSCCLQIFHPECIGYSEDHIQKNITLEAFGKDYKCSSCFWGLFPLYGQAIWFQQPSSKFWPARILFPKEQRGRLEYYKTREVGLYSIKYFGPMQSYYDKASRTSPISLATVKLFTTVKVYEEENLRVKSAFDEAGFYATLIDEVRDKTLPSPEPFYKKIDKNIYRTFVGIKKKSDSDEGTLECYCAEKEGEGPVCTINSGCHNRDTAIECNDENCSGGERCQNRMFTVKKKDVDNTEQFLAPGKGWAVKAKRELKEGDFIIEYCGEIISNSEMQFRANRKTEEDPLYILEIDKHTFIDAEFCGNVSRLINHSCEPNCRIEKYTSDGKPVVGVFAQKDIAKGEELTFDYAYGNNSSAPFRCHCGTETCKGYIGKRVAASDLEIVDAINPELERYDKECAKCHFGGHVLCCDFEDCFKVYHKSCAGLTREPQNEWFCPDHTNCLVKPKPGKKRKTTAGGGPPAKKMLLSGS